MKKLLILTLIFVSFTACNFLSFTDKQPQTQTITGTVIENVMQVPVDGNNVLTVETDSGLFYVLYQEGGLVTPDIAAQQCNDNQLVAQYAQSIQAGDTVEIYGALHGDQPNNLEVCSSTDFYITVLNDDGIQSTRTVTGIVTESITTCEVDGICAYVLETESGEAVTVIWSMGDSLTCNHYPFLLGDDRKIFEVEGETVTAVGRVVDATTISVCDDPSYTIRFGQNNMNNDNSQTPRQVTGTVVELISDCAFDGNCAYVVETETGEQVTVIWAEGMFPICQNDPFQGGDTDIAVGDTIDSLGRVLDANTTSACGDPSYYIRKTS